MKFSCHVSFDLHIPKNMYNEVIVLDTYPKQYHEFSLCFHSHHKTHIFEILTFFIVGCIVVNLRGCWMKGFCVCNLIHFFLYEEGITKITKYS